MKKSILLLLIGIYSFSQSIAQNQNDFENEMEMLFKEMEKSMQQFEFFFNGDLMKKIDSIDIQKFGLDFEKLEKVLDGKDIDNFSSEDMMDIFHLQMEILQDVDLSQINELFESFGFPNPNLKALPKEEKNEGQNNKKSPTKKKRKTYKM